MCNRFKTRKQAIKFMAGKTAEKAKVRRKAMHVIDPITGKGRLKEFKKAA